MYDASSLSRVSICAVAARSSAGDFTIADGRAGATTMALRQSLVDIQRGRAADPYGWFQPVTL